MTPDVIIDTRPLTIEDVTRVARYGARVHLSPQVVDRIRHCRQLLEILMRTGKPIYGVTTGVGDLSKTTVSGQEASKLSRNIVMSHACGVGEPLRLSQVRGIMFCAAVNFAQGHSGVRTDVVQSLLDLLNHDVTPWVPSQGGMGSLTHMAHVGLTLIGMGQAYVGGHLTDAQPALQQAGLSPLDLREKEGLSLVNGTVSKTGIGAPTLREARRLACWADVAGAMSFEALKGVPFAFDRRLHEARPHAGQMQVGGNLLRLIAGSAIIEKYQHDRVQDARRRAIIDCLGDFPEGLGRS